MQGGSNGIGYGLKYQARCIADVKADTDHTSFLTGTLSLKEENEVHLIRISSAGTELICEGLFSHPNEIWDLASCPFDQRIFSTVFSSGETYGAAIWQIPELYGQLNSPQLERIASLDAHSSKIKCTLWWPTGRHDKLVSIDEQNLFLWSFDTSKKNAQVQSQESAGVLHSLSGGAWDPHDYNALALTCDSSVQLWDLRTMKKTNSIDHPHVRNLDYNVKRKYMLVTAEDESGIHIWDLRMLKFPVLDLPGHTHWTWTIKCNPEYEDLILVLSLYFLHLFVFPVYEESMLVFTPTEPQFSMLIFSKKIKAVYLILLDIGMFSLYVLSIIHMVLVLKQIVCSSLVIDVLLLKQNLWQSAGTDSAVNLWLASPPSDDKPTSESFDSPNKPVDPLLNSYSDYEDSVYGLTWSCREPWIFASLSYDGRVVVESTKPHLPRR